jgi:cell division protease FtsH
MPESSIPEKRPGGSPARPPVTRTWLAWLLMASFAALLLFRPSGGGKQVPYSEVRRRIEAGEIAEVKLSPGKVIAVPKAPSGQPAQKVEPLVAGRVDDPQLVQLLEQKKVIYTGIQDGDWWSGLFAVWGLPLLLGGLLWYMMSRGLGRGGGLMSPLLNVGRSRAKLVAEEGTGVSFADVAGVDEAVDELREIVDFLAAPERFRRLGGRIPKGVLLVGPPGTGKTLIARAVAGEAKVPFFSLTGSDFVEMFVGVGAARVRDLFEQAQAKAPCIIFIDELDAIGKARGIVGSFAGHDEREQTLNQLLSEMDGFDARKGLIVMAATNRPEILDPALLRPGRFDRQVLVDRPDVRGRLAILEVHARKVKLAPDVDLRAIAGLTPGFAGAELANIVNEAALLAGRRSAVAVTMADFNEAVERVVAGLEKRNRRMNPREKDIVSHHEAGHALLAQVLPTTDRVHKLSMIPRGLSALGYTMQVPLEDRYLLSRAELLDRITVLLGGRAAEQVIFGDYSTGAQDDLERATDLARRMVAQFGMSERVGPQSLVGSAIPREARMIPGMPLGHEREFSERTHQLLDGEVAELLRRVFRRAVALLDVNREQLARLATRLRDKEVVEGSELEELLAGAHAPEPLASTDESRWEHAASATPAVHH